MNFNVFSACYTLCHSSRVLLDVRKKKNYARVMVTCMTKTDPVLAFRFRRWQTLNSFTRPLTIYHRSNRLVFWRSARTSSALFCMLFSGHKTYIVQHQENLQ